MLCSVFLATSTVKATLVGPRKGGSCCCWPRKGGGRSGRGGNDDVSDDEGEGDTVPEGSGRMRSWIGASRSASWRRAAMLWNSVSTCSCSCVTFSAIWWNSSESLKLLEQQLGAYRHCRLRLPQRWHGVSPLHLILRRLHSLQAIEM